MILYSRELTVASRIQAVTDSGMKRDSGMQKSMMAEWIQQATAYLASLAVALTPKAHRKRDEDRLRLAGIGSIEALKRFRAIRMLGRTFPVGCFIVWILVSPSINAFLGSVVLFALGEVGPRIWLIRRVRFRARELITSLPGVLDLLTISVEAGLGFDQALGRIARTTKGSLGLELQQVLAEMALGRSRKDALRDMADRLHSEDIRTFVTSVIQAERMGMGMGPVLRSQSEEARRRTRQRAEERAMKAPVKILFPLIFFLFPGLFVVILGPAFLHIVSVFSH